MILQALDPLAKIMGSWCYDPSNIWGIIFKILLATILGGGIGAERCTKHHIAGFRTYVLVCLGSTVCMMINSSLSDSSDSVRLAAGVITGVGFLGAGTILVTTRSQVRGLTAAAALWATCALGIAVGANFYSVALISFIVILFTLAILPYLERALQRRSKEFDIHVELNSRPVLKDLIDNLREKGLIINSITYDMSYAQTGLSVYTLTIYVSHTKLKSKDVVEFINRFDYVHFAEVI